MERTLLHLCSFGHRGQFLLKLTPVRGAWAPALSRSDGMSKEALPGLMASPGLSHSLRFPLGNNSGVLQALGGGGISVALLLPGVLLIVSLPSQGPVSHACCPISTGPGLPAGRATSWGAQGRSQRLGVHALLWPGSFLRHP